MRTKRAPDAMGPDRPRAAHVTSCPAARARVAIARPRNWLPPKIKRRMELPARTDDASPPRHARARDQGLILNSRFCRLSRHLSALRLEPPAVARHREAEGEVDQRH